MFDAILNNERLAGVATALVLFVAFTAWGYARKLWWRLTHRG